MADFYTRHYRSGTTTERAAYGVTLANVAADIGRLWWDTTLSALYYWTGAAWTAVSGGGSSYYQTVKEAGVAETQRAAINFVDGTGIDITATDDAGNDETDVQADLNVPGLTAEATADDTDLVIIYDDSATAVRKMTRANFLAGSGGGSVAFACNGRLTLTTGVPVTTTNVAGAGTLYFTPYRGNIVTLYGGTAWEEHTLTEISLTLSTLTASTMYDIFIYDNAGTLTLDAVAWTNTTTRATALATQDGHYVKSGSATHLYIGTIYVDASKQCNEVLIGTPAKLHVSNHYNRESRPFRIVDTTATWIYNTATWRARNGTANNQLQVVRGLDIDPVKMTFLAAGYSTNGTAFNGYMNIGVDWTSGLPSGANSIAHPITIAVVSVSIMAEVEYEGFPGTGYHTLTLLERGYGTASNLTWIGQPASGEAGYYALGAVGEAWA